jgi:predicted AlkP superfamily phosphohydrolase/phosphomutase
MHHGFWRYADPAHPLHEPGHRLEHALRDYYVLLDTEVGRLLESAPAEAAVLVVSDHGGRALQGCLRINEWLIREGYMALRTLPASLTRPAELDIDWRRTSAWAEGGYYARIFLNVRGREPEGIVEPAECERVRGELAARLEAIPAPDGRSLGNRAWRPEELYPEVRGIPPDLIVTFGGLGWRAAGTVTGNGAIHQTENDTGPDDANHSQHGILILHDPLRPMGGRELAGLHIQQVAPTLLGLLDLAAPASMERGPIELPVAAGFSRALAEMERGAIRESDPAPSVPVPPVSPAPRTPEEEETLRRRLEDLGYY